MLFDPDHLNTYPLDPGVYLMKNLAGKIIYIGKANSLKKRLKQYFSLGGDTRPTIPLLLNELSQIDTIIVPSGKEALLLENTLIKKHKPKFNILLKDDKNYISLSINPKEEWPRLKLTRFKSKPQDGSLHFGPYTNARAARETFELMTRLFPLRQCSDEELKRRTRPCLLYGMKRCIAPCVQKCSKEEYTTFVEEAIHFIKGKSKTVLHNLEKEMLKASDALDFEKAAALLRTIRQIEHVTEGGSLASKAGGRDTDVLGLYKEGDKALLIRLLFRQGSLVGSQPFLFENVLEEDEELLSSFILQEYGEEASLPEELLLPFSLSEETDLISILRDIHKKPVKFYVPQKGDKKELIDLANDNAKASFKQSKEAQESFEKILLILQESLLLQRYPKKIECFDTSNLSGTHLVAAAVVFIDGKEDTKKTRLYHVKDIHTPDDYAALHQVLTRRLLRAKEEDDFPDLLIIDGGKGQLSTAEAVLRELDLINVDVVSLVKDKGRHDKGITLEKVYISNKSDPITFPFNSPALFFLQNIRDQAHTKAIAFHRKTRAKKTIQSALDSIPGIGPVKKKKLLQHFGSLRNILASSDAEILSIPGITQKDIDAIKKN